MAIAIAAYVVRLKKPWKHVDTKLLTVAVTAAATQVVATLVVARRQLLKLPQLLKLLLRKLFQRLHHQKNLRPWACGLCVLAERSDISTIAEQDARDVILSLTRPHGCGVAVRSIR